jgi:multidrug efflux pump subunit AcrB
MFIEIPKGFFPNEDTGLIFGLSEAAQDVSPKEMMRLQEELAAVILRDPDVATFDSNMGSGGGSNTTNTGRFFITLKPRDQRIKDFSDKTVAVMDILTPEHRYTTTYREQ